MRKALAVLAALALALCAACAALAEGDEYDDETTLSGAPLQTEGLVPAAPVTGVRLYPEGASEGEAQYRLSYAYPQFEARTEADAAINEFYRSLSEDAALLNPPEDGMTALGEAAYTELGYRVARNDEQYLSVIMTSLAMLGNAENETISANTFARDGLYAGQPLSLTQVLGLEREDDALDGGQSLAESIALKLVWEIVSAAGQNTDAGYLEGIDERRLYEVFSPESDFYLDADGNIVFFIQSGEIAGEVAGVLYFPFAPAELLSAAR